MNHKIEKQLNFTCSTCLALYQLLEIHQKEKQDCPVNCLKTWRELLNNHYQEQIILNLDQEAQKEDENE